MRATDGNTGNLVARLFSYSPRLGRTPLEDFSTEALAWCLTVCPNAADRLMALLRNRLKEPTRWGKINVHTGAISVSTQEICDPRDEDDSAARFDLVIRPQHAADFMVVIESKVAAAPNVEEQIAEYRRKLDFHYGEVLERCVVALTIGRYPIETADAQVSWSDVAECLESCDSGYRTQFDEIVQFLRSKGLIPVKLPQLGTETMQHFLAAAPFLNAMNQCFSSLGSYPTLKNTFAPRHRESPKVDVNNDGTAWYGIYGASDNYVGLYFRTTDGNPRAGLCAQVRGAGDQRKAAIYFKAPIGAALSAGKEFDQTNPKVEEGLTWFTFATAWPASGKSEEICEWFEQMFAAVQEAVADGGESGA